MLDTSLREWLDAQADALDRGLLDGEAVLTRLGASGVLRLGVGSEQGGSGGDVVDAVEAIAQVAGHSLTVAFVFWGQRAFVEYLLQSDNAGLRERLLPPLLSGEKAGATGLSNAMKYLSGIEQLGVTAQTRPGGWQLDGRLPWVTNLRKSGFSVAAAIELPGAQPFVAALPDDLPGLVRSDDLLLLGLQSSNTAAVQLTEAFLSEEWLLAADARQYLPKVRPAFLGLQCGMSLGLARRSLAEARGLLQSGRSVLEGEWQQLSDELERLQRGLYDGLRAGSFGASPVALFKLRIGLAQVAAEAVQLELQASGGKAYLQAHGAGFARRLRESAFVPIVTPSLVQLRAQLRKHGELAA
ncbi:MAG: acyl-CoA dehydrogenase family protein [Pseudomonas sp.]|uniref:acyl-CoA dehydrogenase family protein n=1 Tax=Pseudomonas sp. TaxID=306 RepID=UPI003D0CC36E